MVDMLYQTHNIVELRKHHFLVNYCNSNFKKTHTQNWQVIRFPNLTLFYHASEVKFNYVTHNSISNSHTVSVLGEDFV